MNDSSHGVLAQPPHSRAIVRRRVKPDFALARDRHVWSSERDDFTTDFCNAYTMLLTDESYFVSVVRHALPTTRDPALERQLRGWLAQETSHGIQHTKALQVLDRQGLRHRLLLRVLQFVNYDLFARILGRRLMLFVIAGLEHFNTMLGEMFLRRPDCFRDADERMALLLRWHFAEEIEHRSVIHDVASHHGMGYVTRVLTGLVAFYFYSFNLFVSAWTFSCQRGGVLQISTYRRFFRFLFLEECFVWHFFSYLRDYLRLDFHPSHRPIDELAEPVLTQVGGPLALRAPAAP